jgi:hypothetical protein
LDLHAGHLGFKFGAADLPVHDRLAGFAEGFQVSGSGRQGHVLDQTKGGRPRLTTAEAIELPWSTGPFPLRIPLPEKHPDDRAVKEDRLGSVDRLQAGFSPVQHGVLVNTATHGELRCIVRPVQLDHVRVCPALSHRDSLVLRADEAADRCRFDQGPATELEDLKSAIPDHRVN